MGMMQGMAGSNTVIQTLVPEDKRGRVMSYYTMAFMGMAPFGSLLAGTMAHAIGAPLTVIVNGAAVSAGRGMVRNASACAAARDSAHLQRDGNSARRGGNSDVSDSNLTQSALPSWSSICKRELPECPEARRTPSPR